MMECIIRAIRGRKIGDKQFAGHWAVMFKILDLMYLPVEVLSPVAQMRGLMVARRFVDSFNPVVVQLMPLELVSSEILRDHRTISLDLMKCRGQRTVI